MEHWRHFCDRHTQGQPSGYEEYKAWIVVKYDLDENDDLLADDTAINPSKWAKKRHTSDQPIGFKPK